MPGTEKALVARRQRIRRNQRKNRFSVPRQFYSMQPKVLRMVLKELDLGLPPKVICTKYRVAAATLYRWRKRRLENPQWIPCSRHEPKNRIFTQEEEEAIAAEIKTNFLEKGMVFTDHEFRALILVHYQRKYISPFYEKIPAFNCSNGFIYDFKKRHRFSSRRAHMKRRPTMNAEDLAHWTEQIKILLETVDRDCVINADETSWTVFPGNILTWSTTGSENVSIACQGNDKDCLTVLASITASGGKLPLYFLASGKTPRVMDSQLGDTWGHWRSFSESGWQTSQTFQEYLMHIRELYGDQKVHLILDVHSSHRTSEVKNLAHELNIDLWFIPPGCTDQCQPLDRRCFGALKATARKLWREQIADEPNRRLTKKDAVAQMICAWEHLSKFVVDEAWEVI